MRPLPWLAPLSPLFGAAASVRRSAYERGWIETVRLPVPVYCFGNLTAGGSGKTPGVIWFCGELLSRGRRPAILSRGHGRLSREAVYVPAGDDRGADASALGDEPALEARRLPGAALAIGGDRARSGLAAIETLGADVLCLDDGFQHFRLRRDADFVCVNAHAESASPSGRLLPAGPLREPWSGLGRASVVFLTKSNLCTDDELSGLEERVRRFTPAPVFRVNDALVFVDEGGRRLPEGWPSGRRLLAVSGLGDPRSFEESLRRTGADVRGLRFSDHHRFSEREAESASASARADGRVLITTEKDALRWPGSVEPPVIAALEWDVLNERSFWSLPCLSGIARN